MTWPISLFTACTPWEPLPELAGRAAAAGISGLDLACKPHRFDPAKAPNFWENNAAVLDLERLDELAPAAGAILTAHGLSCPVLAGYVGADDLPTVRCLARAAGVLGAGVVRLFVPGPQIGRVASQMAGQRAAWRDVAGLAADTGVRCAIELHPGTLACSASAALRILDGLDPARVGVILDVANLVCEGNEPLPLVLDWLGPYLAHVHVKDVAATTDGQGWSAVAMPFAPLGRGVVRWPECLRCLHRAGYAGWLAIENFTGIDLGPARIGSDAHWLRARIAESDHD